MINKTEKIVHEGGNKRSFPLFVFPCGGKTGNLHEPDGLRGHQSLELTVDAKKFPMLMKTLLVMPQWTSGRGLFLFTPETGIYGEERLQMKTKPIDKSQNQGGLSVVPMASNVISFRLLIKISIVKCPNALNW